MRYQVKECVGDVLTPISVYQRLQGSQRFILESSSGHGEKGRYSFLGQHPFKEIIGDDQKVTIKQADKEIVLHDKVLEVLKAHIPTVDLNLPFLFYGGAVGYIGYDVIRHYEQIGERLTDEINMPDVHLMMYQDVIIFDHKKETVTLVATDLAGNRDEAALRRALDELETQIMTYTADDEEALTKVSFTPEIDEATFINYVERAKQHIIDGDIFQVVLSQRMKAEFDTSPFQFYRKLRRNNPSPYMYYLDFGPYVVLGASPESLIKVKGNQVVTNPIAGTRPRGKSEAEDLRFEEDLLHDEKERAEHKMLVDLSRNDLGRVCEVHSIQLPKFMTIERFQHVMHIVSEVTGTLKDTYDGIDCLIATLPAGTVSGAPKIRAMQLINHYETVERGVYAGACGYINMNGDLDLALAIRTMVIKNQTAYVQAGAGIVYDSDPKSEYQETLNKAKSLVEVSDT